MKKRMIYLLILFLLISFEIIANEESTVTVKKVPNINFHGINSEKIKNLVEMNANVKTGELHQFIEKIELIHPEWKTFYRLFSSDFGRYEVIGEYEEDFYRQRYGMGRNNEIMYDLGLYLNDFVIKIYPTLLTLNNKLSFKLEQQEEFLLKKQSAGSGDGVILDHFGTVKNNVRQLNQEKENYFKPAYYNKSYDFSIDDNRQEIIDYLKKHNLHSGLNLEDPSLTLRGNKAFLTRTIKSVNIKVSVKENNEWIYLDTFYLIYYK
tara:strand:- start:492 stop:1283 length:792 start_codon:yes stop_codon:yes gene_type:complete